MSNNKSPSLPDRLSHRQLKAMLQSAPAERTCSDPVQDPLADELLTWTPLTKQLLQTLEQQGTAIGEHRSSEQMMALGSFRTHLMLGLQALKAAQS